MIYLFYGDDRVKMRDKAQAVMSKYSVTAVTRLAGRDVTPAILGDLLRARMMFEEKQVIYIEGKFDSKEIDLNLAVSENSANDLLILIEGALRSNEHLYVSLLASGAIIEKVELEPDKEIFVFLDAILQRNRHLAVKELEKLFESGKEAVYINVMLVWQFRQLLAPELTKGFVQKKVLAARKNYSDEDLLKIYKMLFFADAALKSGEGDSEGTILSMVVKMTK